jgi:hypothetical protein
MFIHAFKDKDKETATKFELLPDHASENFRYLYAAYPSIPMKSNAKVSILTYQNLNEITHIYLQSSIAELQKHSRITYTDPSVQNS